MIKYESLLVNPENPMASLIEKLIDARVGVDCTTQEINKSQEE